jgi:hypothetical protein
VVGLEALWWVGALGLLAVLVGSVLLGIWALRAGRLAPAPAVLLIATALAFMVGFNTEDARALMAVPSGAAWAWVGYVLWSGTGARRGDAPPAV